MPPAPLLAEQLGAQYDEYVQAERIADRRCGRACRSGARGVVHGPTKGSVVIKGIDLLSFAFRGRYRIGQWHFIEQPDRAGAERVGVLYPC